MYVFLWMIALFGLLLSAPVTAISSIDISNTTGIRALFLFKDVLESNTTALLTSGFNTLIIFSFGVLGNGDIVYYTTNTMTGGIHTTVASNGTYVGGAALADKARSYKTSPGSSVDRVEISMSSSGTAFQNVTALLQRDGAGPDTVLARNFGALRKAWTLDAFNNDDESVYDVASTLKLAEMLGDPDGAAFPHYTAAPYTNMRFWTAVRQSISASARLPRNYFDRVYLQEYDGGAGNDPATWQTALAPKTKDEDAVNMVPILWVTNDSKPSEGTTPAQADTRFRRWALSRAGISGGGYWNDYDIEKMKSSYIEYGNVLKAIFL
ncbi:hypothetical protein Sste5346_004711 [Sporothrix stenoceras]|uniref:Coagulation factor 5/8 type domain-containing protein n=1 Tax=Sporothrix stenoceras TaxID=5173 RepID=A0ABR3Z7Z2_9PEZI